MEQSPTVSAAEYLVEGQAKILMDKKVFYNQVQEFNRDLSIAVLSQYSKERSNQSSSSDSSKGKEKDESQKAGLRVLEALSATGLRSIRYAKEVPGIAEIVANDISTVAVESIKRNVSYNQVENIVIPHNDDATMVMYQNRKTKFDAVDLDPYGSPSVFLDGAVQCIKDNGLLLVTATDMAVLAGNSPETCYVKYGALSLKSKSCHEMALRILLQHIASHAGRYGKVIIPLLSISADFYIRVFVKIRSSQAACKKNASQLGLIYQCVGCESLTFQSLCTNPSDNVYKLPHAPALDKLCSICNHRHHMGGPMWMGPLHDKNFVQQILTQLESPEDSNLKALKTLKRIQGILHVVHEEIDNPLYYQLDRLTATIKCNVPQMISFRSALLNAGYKVSYSHANKTSIKTNAPNQVIWDIVRAWEKGSPVKREKFQTHSAGLAILNGEMKTEVSFKKHPDAMPYSQQMKLTRFQLNPSSNWGPGTRSTTTIQGERAGGKKERNQNKNKRKREENNSESTKVEEKKPNLDEENE